MKTTVRILLLVFLAFIAFNANAQVKIGLKAGGNVAKCKFDIDNDYEDYMMWEDEIKSKMGFHAGLIMDISVMEEMLSIQPALLFSQKGYSVDVEEIANDNFDDVDSFEGYWRFNYYYVELPVNVAYKYKGLQVYGFYDFTFASS